MFYSEGFTVSDLEIQNDKRIKVKLTIAPDCRLGEHSLRIRTESGISDLQTFWVSQFPNKEEEESNNFFDEAQPIQLNVTVNGRIDKEDVDYFILEAKKGQRITAEIEAVRLGTGGYARSLFDPYVAIQDMKRFELSASDDTPLLLQDSVASIIAPTDGKYVIQVRDSAYGGGKTSIYRLHVGTFPRPMIVYPAGGKAGQDLKLLYIGDISGNFTNTVTLPEKSQSRYGIFYERDGLFSPSPNWIRVSDFDNVLEVEPNNGRNDATKTDQKLPLAFNGIIEKSGDSDYFRFEARKGQNFTIRVHARSIRSPLDPVLAIYDDKGKSLGYNDDAQGRLDSSLKFKPNKDGHYFIRITDHLKKGSPRHVYRVEITASKPSLSIQIPRFDRDSQARKVIPVPRGNRYATLINVTREGFGGDLIFQAPDLPQGVRLIAETMPADVSTFPVVFEANLDAPIGGALIDLTARHADPDKAIKGNFHHEVELVVARPNRTVFYATRVNKLALAVTEEAPFTIDLIKPDVPLVQNGLMNLKVVAKRKEGFDGPIKVRMLWNPPGIGSKTTVTIPKGKNEVLYPINAQAKAKTKTWKIAVLGEADAGKGLVLTSSKLMPLTVAAPFVTMKIPMTALGQGQIGQIVCSLEQLEPFEGKAKIKLLGLPAKITTTEKEITMNDKEVIFDINVEPKAPIGKHKALFCQLVVMKNNQPITHRLGYGGILRIDRPIQSKRPVADKKPKTNKAKPAPPKRLSRLELLRMQIAEKQNK